MSKSKCYDNASYGESISKTTYDLLNKVHKINRKTNPALVTFANTAPFEVSDDGESGISLIQGGTQLGTGPEPDGSWIIEATSAMGIVLPSKTSITSFYAGVTLDSITGPEVDGFLGNLSISIYAAPTPGITLFEPIATILLPVNGPIIPGTFVGKTVKPGQDAQNLPAGTQLIVTMIWLSDPAASNTTVTVETFKSSLTLA